MPHKTLLSSLAAGALLAGLAVGLPAVASADEPADCAAAVTALNAAFSAHKDAVDADDKAAAAKDADQKLEDAQKEHSAAKANVAPISTRKGAQDAVDLIDKQLADNPSDLEKKVLNSKRKDLVRFIEADKGLEQATKDAGSDAVALQNKADKTDAKALLVDLNKARADFNRLCVGQPDPTGGGDNGNPGNDGDNGNDDNNGQDENLGGGSNAGGGDDLQVDELPTGGVATGGGPA